MSIGIGDSLRAARREQGRAIADAAAATRVRESYLAALEEEDFGALGGDVYVRGFLRSYARYLGLDPEPLIAAYRDSLDAPEEGVRLAQRPVAPIARERPAGVGVVALIAVALLVVLAGIGLWSPDDQAAVEQPAVPPPATPSPTPEPAPAPAGEAPAVTPAPEAPGATPETPAATPVEGVEVQLTVTGAVSWMRVTVDGEQVFEGEEPGGFTRTFHGDERVQLRIGDASAVSLVVNGQDQGTLGGSGAVVDLSFAVEDLT